MNTATKTAEQPDRTTISPWLVWFGVLGGVVCWTVQLFMSWSVMELACVANGPGRIASATVWVSTGVPWLGTIAATAAILRVRARISDAPADDLASGRLSLLATVGLVLDLFSLGIITASGVAILVLRPCS